MKAKTKEFLKETVPGLITGGADNDPSGITSYSISAASFGYSQLWLMLIATPMLIAVQGMTARIANVTRRGLSTLLHEKFSPFVSWTASAILVISNIVTIGADIVAVSFAFELVTGISYKWLIAPVTIGIWYLVVFKSYKVIRRFLLWMVVFFLSYAIAAVLAHPDWLEVAKGLFLPTFGGKTRDYYVAAVAILGTTITPYVFFWQAEEEIEEHKSAKEALKEARREDRVNAPGFIFSQIITMFIMIASGATIFGSGESIRTAADAAKALEPLAGHAASLLFAIGIIGAGLLAIPVLSASTAEVISEAAHIKHHSLNNRPKTATFFYGIISLSLLMGILIVIIGIDPLKAMIYSQVLAGLLAPVLLLLIMILANRKSIMGRYTNGWFDNIFGLLTLIIMTGAAILMFAS